MTTLHECGFEINFFEDNKVGYYRVFNKLEPNEIRILVDAVQASFAVSHKETEGLIRKLKNITDKETASKIDKNLSYFSRAKTENSQVFSNIDAIQEAIESNKKISFKYTEYNIEKKLVLKNNGDNYIFNPYGMACNNDFYYLIGNIDKYENIAHFRIDRIKDISILDEKRKPVEKTTGDRTVLKPLAHISKAFNMYAGEKVQVELKFHNGCINSVIDRFGTSISILRIDEEYFKIGFDAFDGWGLIFWILQFADGCEVLRPIWLREEITRTVESMVEIYKKSHK
jgi:predicted DNA-binding transcriptional regulator YafY